MSTAVTDATFDTEVLASDKPVIVDFWAAWCAPCRAISPIIDEIGEQYGDKVSVVKLDVDANMNVAMKYAITSIPVIKVFKNGEEVKSLLGARSKASFEQELAEYLN